MVPHAARDAGFGYTVEVDVHAPPRRPLRSPESVDPLALQPLEERTNLFALASIRAPRAEAAAIAAPLIARWGPAQSAQSWSLGVFHGTVTKRPSSGTARGDAFFTSARWKKLQAEMATAAQVTAEVGHDDWIRTMSRQRTTSGFAFGGSIIGAQSRVADDSELMTLGLWRDASGDDRAESFRLLLVELIDELVTRGGLAQAFMGHWSWVPSTFDSTPYETGCDIHGSQVLQQSWLDRWLRGVTRDWIWLGAPLLAHVDRAALDRVAELVPIADGLRLRVRDDLTLDDLEAALAPILPDAADSRAAEDRFYGRA